MSDSVTLWTVACQAPPSMGFPRQEYWSGLPFPSPGDLPDPGIQPISLKSPSLASQFFTASTRLCINFSSINYLQQTFALHAMRLTGKKNIYIMIYFKSIITLNTQKYSTFFPSHIFIFLFHFSSIYTVYPFTNYCSVVTFVFNLHTKIIRDLPPTSFFLNFIQYYCVSWSLIV